ncbi:MAG: CRISPR-associated protein Cas7 [Ignavibacteria bacterium]|nr:CRISPR-associated protein Cas7 [Ignavibacteria bacterium]
MQQPFIYLRALRHADHTVFCVQDGQKTYWDNQFGKYVPFSSGQQVKRSMIESILSSLGASPAPITFNYEVSKKEKLGNGEPWSPCDPSYPDQILAGWMKAATDEVTIKRRSPLSISAMRPLHPLLANTSSEAVSYNASNNPNLKVRVRWEGGNELTPEELASFLTEKKVVRPLNQLFFPEGKVGPRASGLFVYDIALDLRTLFCVSLNQHEPELRKDTIEKLRAAGWVESKNVFGACLVCPKDEREKIITALAHGLIQWRITSNQARTYSPMETLAVAISDNANKLAAVIRAKLKEGVDKPAAEPIVDNSTVIAGTSVFVTPPCDGYIVGVHGTITALDDAEQELITRLRAFDYEKQ